LAVGASILATTACDDAEDPDGGGGSGGVTAPTTGQGSSKTGGPATTGSSTSSSSTGGTGGGPNGCEELDPGCTVWSKRFGDAADQYGVSLRIDAAGDLILAGNFGGTLDLGGSDLTSAGEADIYLAKLDAAGNHLWSKRFGSASEQYLASATVDDDGNVILTGDFSGSIDFGGGPLTGAGAATAIFVAKLDAMGNHMWSTSFDGGGGSGLSIAVDALGDVVVTGDFHGTVDFGGGPLATLGDKNIFVVKLDAAGNHMWSKSFGDGDDQVALAVAQDPGGDLVVAGYIEGTADFGGGMLTSAGGWDVFVTRLDSMGNHVWSERYGSRSFEFAHALTIDAAGDVVVAGTMSMPVDFGGGPLAVSGGTVFVAKLAPGGDYVWSKGFASGGMAYPTALATDIGGDVVLSGYFSGVLDVDGVLLDGDDSFDAFVAKLDPSGNHVWSRRYGNPEVTHGISVALDAGGSVFFTGNMRGTVDFGTGPLVSAGGYDVFVAELVL
jgi:hypothetical protein